LINKRCWKIITLFYMGCLLAYSLKPGANFGTASSIKQVAFNLAHVPAYALLTLLLVYSLDLKTLNWAFMVSVSYGIFNEFVQSFSPGRAVSIFDILLNVLGCWLFLYFLKKGQLEFLGLFKEDYK